MGYRWDIVCLDNEQRTGCIDKLAVAFYTSPHVLESVLVRGRSFKHPLPSTRPTAPLERLPSHIKRRICQFLAAVDPDGLLCVIVAIPHMATEGQSILDGVMTWAGKRVITIGEYAVEPPPNCMTTEEKERWRTDDDDFWRLDKEKFTRMSDIKGGEGYDRAYEYLRDLRMRSNGRRPYRTTRDYIYPPVSLPEDAVLRNLTLKQYFKRCDNKDNRDRIFTFGRVIMILTCWSDDPSTSFHIEWDESDAHGDWAGHRLDIVSADMLSDDWEDVTEAVKEKIVDLCYESDMSEWEEYDAEASASQDESAP